MSNADQRSGSVPGRGCGCSPGSPQGDSSLLYSPAPTG